MNSHGVSGEEHSGHRCAHWQELGQEARLVCLKNSKGSSVAGEKREGQAGSGRTAVHVVHCTTQEGATHMHHGGPCRTQSAQILTRPWGGR